MDKVPIVEVCFVGEFVPNHPGAYNDLSMAGEILTIAQSSKISFDGDGSTIPMVESGIQAENSPLSAEQARAFVEELIASYETTTGPVGFRLQGQLTLSREYQKIKKGNDQVGIDFHTPVTEMGSYQIQINAFMVFPTMCRVTIQ